MTSASELFNNRRSRFGRSSEPFDAGSDFSCLPLLNRGGNRRQRNLSNSHHQSSSRRDRVDSSGCDSPRRAPQHSRQTSQHRSYHTPHDRDSLRLEHGGHQFASGNDTHSGSQNIVRDRVRFNENDRLPGPVLLARERLSRRLSHATLFGSRPSNRSSQNNHENEMSIGNELWLIDAGDWETDISRDWLTMITSVTDIADQQMSKRPPGLDQEALKCLHIEAFCIPEKGMVEEDSPIALTECSICLESFLDGDKLICLPCGHRYHVCCLNPWVRTCGDCPYCRRDILVTTTRVPGLESSGC